MNSTARIGLTILAVVAVVFGITFVTRYDSGDGLSSGILSPEDGKTVVAKDEPLKFFTTIAVVPPVNAKISARERHLLLWRPEIEVDQPGDYEFWCQNKHPVPVTVRVTQTSCQCAGAEIGIVPPDDWASYVQASALGGGPFCPSTAVVALAAHAALDRAMTWSVLYRKGLGGPIEVPAADPIRGPQMAMVRMAWTGKAPTEAKRLTAALFTNFPDALPVQKGLEAHIAVVPSFILYRREPNRWDQANEIQVGDLQENSAVHQTLFCASATRSHMVFSIDPDSIPDPCITWTEPKRASVEEMSSLQEFLNVGEKTRLTIQSLYKMEVFVRERTTVDADGKKALKQLDLGLLDRRVKVTAVAGGSQPLTLRGHVRGEIRVEAGTTGPESGRIDLGNSFPAEQDRTKAVKVIAERQGLDVTIVADEIVPNFLKVTLEPLTPIDGRKQWRLQVTVPKGTLYSSLPEQSSIILKTNDETPRRVRIPVRGTAVNSEGPRL